MPDRQIKVNRWSVISQKPFDTVVATVEGAIGRPKMDAFSARTIAATTYEEMKTIVRDSVGDIGLMEFMRLDLGAVLAKSRSGR